ncbi:ribokinase [Sedimentibacter acidaminivorans]|uniref:Ribokinase n=1 Tax=Sedimentibacter acidaminivorans TaxID=913099 RepID=A0ABS4G9V5_9FIRM|nr:ribokinase [Sedimentibacter acidaminivorans]MBP1924475.1 ribokinase [Sedimentibacter acidaminivorans]
MRKVVVIGSINVDMVFTSSIRPNAGETVLGQNFYTIPGGKGANQAVAASKLGSSSYMIGCVGSDGNGDFSIQNLKEMNVDITCIEKINSVPTGVANIVVAEGDNSIIVVPGSNYKLTKEIINKNKYVIQDADIVLIQLEIPVEVVEYTVELCKKYNIKVMLNPAPALKLSDNLIQNSTYITPNEHELKIIFGKDNSENTDDILRQYPNKLIVTMGSKGVKYFDGEEIRIIPAYKVDILDTTGAGDTFNGGLASALVRGENLEEAIKFANKAAALSITKLGAQSGMPTLEQLENLEDLF